MPQVTGSQRPPVKCQLVLQQKQSVHLDCPSERCAQQKEEVWTGGVLMEVSSSRGLIRDGLRTLTTQASWGTQCQVAGGLWGGKAAYEDLRSRCIQSGPGTRDFLGSDRDCERLEVSTRTREPFSWAEQLWGSCPALAFTCRFFLMFMGTTLYIFKWTLHLDNF